MDAGDLISPVGLIAGNGIFPLEFAASARSRGLDVIAVAHTGETLPEIEREVSSCTWIKVGEVGRAISVLKRAGVRQVAFAGGISKIRLFGGFKLDVMGLMLLTRLRSTKDDVLLRGVAEELERNGLSVFSASVLLEKSVPRAGALSSRGLSGSEAEDAMVAWEAAKEIGRLDIGQAVIAAKGIVVAVEAVEGTDAAIKRAGELAGRGVLVKRAKPQQDLRFDLPTVGPKTLENMKAAGLTAVVVEAGRSLILDPEQVVRFANANGMAVVSIADGTEIASLGSREP